MTHGVEKGSPATFDMMSPSLSKSRRSKRSKADSAPRPRNRRLDADEMQVAEKVATKPGKRKAKGAKGGASKPVDRREERRLAREARLLSHALLALASVRQQAGEVVREARAPSGAGSALVSTGPPSGGGDTPARWQPSLGGDASVHHQV